jgi:hypothetical protein
VLTPRESSVKLFPDLLRFTAHHVFVILREPVYITHPGIRVDISISYAVTLPVFVRVKVYFTREFS